MGRMFKFAPLLLALLFVAPAFAQNVGVQPGSVGIQAIGGPIEAPAAVVPADTKVIAIQSPAPVSIGSWGAEVLAWVAAAFGGLAGTALTAWLVKLAKLAGIEATDAMRARLQQIIINGLNAAASTGEKKLDGKLQVMVKSDIVNGAIAYTQAHGADTLKALGLDPNGGAAVEAIKARIETAIADPSSPTPAVLSK